MILKVKKKYVYMIDKVISHLTEKYSFSNEDVLFSRIIWNYFTNNNKERKRARLLIEKYLVRKELDMKINDVLNIKK